MDDPERPDVADHVDGAVRAGAVSWVRSSGWPVAGASFSPVTSRPADRGWWRSRASFPGRIFPVEVAPGKGFLVHRHGWVCGTQNVNATVALQQNIRGAIWGGEGFILQKLEGEGTAWIELSGEVFNYRLRRVRPCSCTRATSGLFEDSVQFPVIRMQGISNYLFGADGHHLVTSPGPGNIWLQSMPIPVLAGALTPYMAKDEHGGTRRDGGRRRRRDPRQRARRGV